MGDVVRVFLELYQAYESVEDDEDRCALLDHLEEHWQSIEHPLHSLIFALHPPFAQKSQEIFNDLEWFGFGYSDIKSYAHYYYKKHLNSIPPEVLSENFSDWFGLPGSTIRAQEDSLFRYRSKPFLL